MQIFNYRPAGVMLEGGAKVVATFDFQLQNQAIRLHNLQLRQSVDGTYRVMPAMTRVHRGEGRTRAYSLGPSAYEPILRAVLSFQEQNAPIAPAAA